MIHKRKQPGFTIVELLVVIVVIAILASITLVAYSNVQKNAMDAKIRTTADDVGKALLVRQFDGQKPVSGYFTNGNGTTTFGVDMLVVPDFMAADYRSDLTSTNSTSYNAIFRYYPCGTGFALYATLNKPSDDDLANFTATKTQCGTTDAQAPISGNYKYNYAKIFR